MLKPFAVLLAIGLVIPGDVGAQQVPASAHTVLVPKNTALKFALLGPLDPAKAKVGDDVPLRLVRPLFIDGATLLPADEVVHARVTKVKDLNKKCGDREADVELDQISFTDSTTAKTEVLFVSNRPDIVVDRTSDTGSHLAPSDIPGIVVVSLVTLPLYLLLPFAHSPCQPPTALIKPANSTVAVIFTKDHRIRY